LHGSIFGHLAAYRSSFAWEDRMGRRSPVLVSFAVVGFALLAMLGAATAQEATPEVVFPAPLDRFAAAWEARDPDAIAALYADDAVLTEAVLGSDTWTGPEEIREWAANNFAGFPDLALVASNAFVSGDHAAMEWIYTGSYTGEIPGLPPGTGQQIAIPGASVLEFRDGLIVRDTMYYDRATFEAQFMAGMEQANNSSTP
jgi:steroid delta-isomerase-like uncharacterized protein